MNAKVYRLVIETLLTLILMFIIGLVIYGWVAGSPSHIDLQSDIRSLQNQVTILNCQVVADGPIDRAACVELIPPE